MTVPADGTPGRDPLPRDGIGGARAASRFRGLAVALGAVLCACGGATPAAGDASAAPDTPLDTGPDTPPDTAAPAVIDPGVISRSAMTVMESESHVATAADGRVAVAWIGRTATTSGIGYALSRDGGRSFGPVMTLTDPAGGDAADPVLANGRDGTFYLAWLGFKVDMDGLTYDAHVYVSRAAPDATAFSPGVEVSDPAETPLLIDKPTILTTPGGTVVAMYMRQTGMMGRSSSLVAARSTDGDRWTRSVIAPEGMQINHLVHGCAGARGGRVWATHVNYLYVSQARAVMLRWSDDEGATWPAANVTTVTLPDETNASFDDPHCVAEGDRVWVQYGLTDDTPGVAGFGRTSAIRLAASSDGGRTIDARYDVHDPAVGPYYLHPQLVREDDGALDLAYYAGTRDEDAMGTVRRSRSTDGGMRFGPSVAVHTPVRYTQARGSRRWLGDYFGAAWRAGDLYVAYMDNAGVASHVAFYRTPVR